MEVMRMVSMLIGTPATKKQAFYPGSAFPMALAGPRPWGWLSSVLKKNYLLQQTPQLRVVEGTLSA
jgi:hypothetical protein